MKGIKTFEQGSEKPNDVITDWAFQNSEQMFAFWGRGGNLIV